MKSGCFSYVSACANHSKANSQEFQHQCEQVWTILQDLLCFARVIFLRLPWKNTKFMIWHWSWFILVLTLKSYRSSLSICFLECKTGYYQPGGNVMNTKSCKCPNTRPSRNEHFRSFPLLLFSLPLSLSSNHHDHFCRLTNLFSHPCYHQTSLAFCFLYHYTAFSFCIIQKDPGKMD